MRRLVVKVASGLALTASLAATSGCTTCITYPDTGSGSTVECRTDTWPTTIP